MGLFENVNKTVATCKAAIFVLVALLALLTGIIVVSRLSPPLVRQLAFICDGVECRPTAVPTGSESKIFIEEKIDLTGDGIPETVKLDQNRLFIFQNGVEIWSSNPGWQVVDVALGDPNNDGRNDILVALWKPDQESVLTSHPFIVGYRGGRFKTIWGGSAVPYGIHELLLADVDGNGIQELVILESAHHGDGPEASLFTLSVWDWHGWGFILRWRSEPGYYRNLGFIPDPEGGGTVTLEETH
jgi:hypothetical protein